MEYKTTDFRTDVLEASYDTPVLVDFWAPWCGPCRQLGPVLERLAAEQDDWTLVKLNTDEHSDTARRYGVRGIPAVKLFVDGTVEAEFTGALPEHAVRKWLDEHLPSEAKSRLAKARTALNDGRRADAAELLEPVLDEDALPEIKVRMAQALAFDDPSRAYDLASSADVPDPSLRQVCNSVETVARLVALDPADLPEDPVKDVYVAATEALAEQNFDAAVDRFVDAVRQNRDYDDDGARKACVALFTLLGPKDPVTRKHRRSFDMALY